MINYPDGRWKKVKILLPPKRQPLYIIHVGLKKKIPPHIEIRVFMMIKQLGEFNSGCRQQLLTSS